MEEEPLSSRPARLVNFVSEEQLEESKKTRGHRPDDGTAQRDKPLYEILRENKEKKDAEFNERFKHRPPKALDEDESEFLDNLEMSRREYEKQVADEEIQQLRSFQEAVAARSSIVYELKETPPKTEEQRSVERKNRQLPPLGMLITVKPQAKKAKIDTSNSDKPLAAKPPNGSAEKSQEVADGALAGLVSYSDESDDEDS